MSAAIAELDAFVSPADRPLADAQVNLVVNAPGAALLVWGAEAICLAYNRGYRTISGLRVNAVGKPLLRVLPELERPWKGKLDLAMTGTASLIDGSVFVNGPEGINTEQMGWLLPVAGGEGQPKGVLVLFMDASPVVDPMRRVLAAVAHDLREPLIGIQVVAERLARLPKVTRERTVEDMERVTELTGRLDRTVDDLGAYARRASAGGGARVSLRPLDMGAVVRKTCETINATKGPKVLVRAAEMNGLWDEDAIQRIVTSLVVSARQQGPETSAVEVELVPTREGAMLSVKDDGLALRGEDAEQLFEPWKRGGAPGAERRRRGVGVGLYLARELVQAHGGRISVDRGPQGGFVLRVLLPTSGNTLPPASPAVRPDSQRTLRSESSLMSAVTAPPPRMRDPAEPISSRDPPSFDGPPSESAKPRSGPRR